MKMPFGKFAGAEIADLPDDYLRWLHDDIELRDPLSSAIDNEYTRRFVVTHGKAPSSAVRTMAAEIVTAGFRKMAMQHHPDHAGGDTRTMQLLNEAADFLRQAVRTT